MTPINKTEKSNLNLDELSGIDGDLGGEQIDQEIPGGEAVNSVNLEANNTDAQASDTTVQDTNSTINPNTVTEALKKANRTVPEQREIGVEEVISKVTTNDPNKTAGSQKARHFLFEQAQGTNAA